jgi:hypothetical protein
MRRLVLVLAVAGALFGVATAVEAAIPDGGGVIHGCYAKTSKGQQPAGSLRVIDTGQTCQSNEAGLKWSQTGPKGATGLQGTAGQPGAKGATGPKGTTGDQGPAGSSVAYAKYSGHFEISTGVDVVTVTVPPGRYTLSATVDASAALDHEDTDTFCSLAATSGQVDANSGHIVIDGLLDGPIIEGSFPLIGDLSTSSQTDVSVYCFPILHEVDVDASLIATPVASINLQ